EGATKNPALAPSRPRAPGQSPIGGAGLFGLPLDAEKLAAPAAAPPPRYSPTLAKPTETLPRLLPFRSVNPLYGAFLVEHLGIADRTERLQALESVLGLPGPVLRYVRPPRDLSPGPLAMTRLDEELIRRGLMAAPIEADDEAERDDREPEERPPSLAEKLRLLFDSLYPDVGDFETQSVWVAGELFFFGGNFNNYVKTRDLTKQEGLIFRHLLRLILLCEEFAAITPPELSADDWQAELRDLSQRLAASCREVDPASTEELIAQAHAADVVEGETTANGPVLAAGHG
ncbi:MAG TPA: helicase, partial [Pirellulales bacterium]|nr:helicase [Pirellulales bacterium]